MALIKDISRTVNLPGIVAGLLIGGASVAGATMLPGMAAQQAGYGQNGAVVQQQYPQPYPQNGSAVQQQYPSQSQYPASGSVVQQQHPNQYPQNGAVVPQQRYPSEYPQQPNYGGQPVANTGYATAGSVIPAGTLITITPTQSIQQAQPGSTYSARISDNVMGPNGSVLIPAGSPAQLTVTNAVSPTGASELALALQSVTVNGRTYNVATSSAQGRSSQTQVVGQGNALGASSMGGMLGTLVRVLGAGQTANTTNTSQGTAGSGALGGILGQILTRGANVNVPSQAQLTFRLNQPLQLQ